VVCREKHYLHSTQFIAASGNSGDEPDMAETYKALSLENILQQNKTKVKQNAIVGQMAMTTMMMVLSLQCLIPRAIA
jgi:hypothetical protein